MFFLRATVLCYLEINFDGSMQDQANSGGSGFAIGVFIIACGVRIFNTIVSNNKASLSYKRS